ncbi:hypothetical protein CBR_g46423 [Chara braunii]|uniref:Uncharacterized protein n=1 Tax=Chara braunii TaxID=69332 RepID=A0A388M0F3_CHABU|nr:hypothetical protein CBR_g46423 [Chara braunii]|eukprot:GBG88054.1 hypothetical protein CBR_g46423 [Chara braunii]
MSTPPWSCRCRRLCSGCESSGAAAEGGDLGSGPATQLHCGESRGQFNDSEDEGTAPPLSDTRRSVLFIPGVQTDAPVQRKSTGPAGEVAAYSEVDLEASEGQSVEEVNAGGLGSQGAPQKRRGDRPDEFTGSTKKLKSKAPRTVGEKRKGTEGEQGRQVAKRPSSRQKQPETGLSSPPTIGTPIDVDAGYFLEYKDGVPTKREFEISPAQVVDLGDWEDLYNQRSLDPVLVEGIKEAMRLAFENKAQSYDLPTLNLTPLGLDKPTPGTKAERLRPEDWRDELRDNTTTTRYQKGEEAIRKQGAALRSYFPLAMAGENVWKLAVEFFERWEIGRLLGHDGAKWIMRKKKVKNVQPGVAYIDNDKLGRKEVVYNVPVDPPTKKGKKEKEEGEWFVQVPESDAHCWKTMESLTDNEKCRVLKMCSLARWFGYRLAPQQEELRLGSYSSLISTEDEETTGIEFDATADEEGSDTESLDLQYDQHSAQHATWLSLAGPSTSPASLVSPMAKLAPGTTPMKLLQRMQALASDHRSLRPGSDIPPDHLSRKDANIHFLPEPQSRSTEADWGHDMISHPGVIQPAIQNGEWIVAVAVPDGGWMPLPRGSRSDFLDAARIAVLQKVRAENDSFAPEDVSVISTVGRLFAELQDKCWLELMEDYYDLDTSPSKGRVDWKIPPPSGTHVSTGSRRPDGGENEGDEAGGGKGVPRRQHEGDEAEGGSQGDTMTAEGSGGVPGEALGRQQSTSPSPEASAQSADMPTSSACSVMAALVAPRAGSSWSGPGVASGHPKIDSGAVMDGTSPPAGDRQPLRSEREGACGGPGDMQTTKFAGIRTSSGKGGQPGIAVQAGGPACGGREVHSSKIDTGSSEVAALHAGEEGRVMDKEKEVEEGDTGEELEEGGDEGEEEEDEGEEGEETELAGLLGGQEGEKGELDIGDDERTFGDDNDRSGESSDGFGQLYGEHREEDDDDDDTALGMETQVVTSLSAERDDYEVEAITSVVDLQHRFNEARVAVSLTKPSVCIDIEEVIDGILGDHHMSAQPSSTPGVDDPLDIKPSGGSVVAFSPTNSPMLPPTIASGGEGGIEGRQDVTSPKKTVAGT